MTVAAHGSATRVWAHGPDQVRRAKKETKQVTDALPSFSQICAPIYLSMYIYIHIIYIHIYIYIHIHYTFVSRCF